MPEGLSTERIDQGWTPGLLRPRAAPSGSLGWIAGGMAVLLLGWLVLSAVGYVADQFARSTAMGIATVLVFGAGLLAVLRGLWREVRSFQQLSKVDALRALLARDDAPVLPARALALEWLGSLERLPDLAQARQATANAPDVPLLRAALRQHLAGTLRLATQRAGSQAAVEGGMVVAISPSPALDGVLAGLRGLSLLRQVAAIHGMRPGVAVTLALLRRLAWTAAGTSGIDLIGRAFADNALSHLPVLRQLAATLPGSGLAALRLKRLAEVTAKACSPIEVSNMAGGPVAGALVRSSA
jgi:putative membrane protein